MEVNYYKKLGHNIIYKHLKIRIYKYFFAEKNEKMLFTLLI